MLLLFGAVIGIVGTLAGFYLKLKGIRESFMGILDVLTTFTDWIGSFGRANAELEPAYDDVETDSTGLDSSHPPCSGNSDQNCSQASLSELPNAGARYVEPVGMM